MIVSGIIKLLVLAFMGAILADVLTHPAGTRAAGDSLVGLLSTAGGIARGNTAAAASGRGGGKRRGR